MSNHKPRFGQLLKAAINNIAYIRNKNNPIIEEELAQAIGVSHSVFERYKSHKIPDQYAVEVLAKECLERGKYAREWVQDFVRAAHHPYAEQFIEQLFQGQSSDTLRNPPVINNLEGASYSKFVMREQSFQRMVEGLNIQSAVVVVSSLGGMGKTSLAHEFATQCVAHKPGLPHFDAIIWISDKNHPGTTNLTMVLDKIAYNLEHQGILKLPFDTKRLQVDNLLRITKCLLIIDNFETIRDDQLAEWVLRVPAPSKAIITSRRYIWGGWSVELAGMNYDEAQLLISEYLYELGLQHLYTNPEDFRSLIEITGGNPKAIKIALGLLRHGRHTLDEILRDFQQGRNDLFDDLFQRAWDLLDLGTRNTLMALTFFDESANNLALQACTKLHDDTFGDVLQVLRELSLIDKITYLDKPARYTMHPLVRTFAEKQLKLLPYVEQETRIGWLEWYVQLADQVGFRWDDLDQLELLDPEHDTLYRAIHWAYDHQHYQQAIRLIEGVRYYNNVRGLWDDQRLKINLLRRDAARQIRDYDNEALALAHHIEIRSKQKHLDEAAALREELLIVAETPNLHPDTVFEIQHALALFARAQQDHQEAEQIWRNLLPLSEQLGGQKYVINRRWLATCRYQQGDHAQAEELYRASLADARACNDVRSVIGNSLKLAALALEHEQYDRAEQLLLECEPVALRFKDGKRLAELYRLRAHIAKAHGDTDLCYTMLAQAIDLFERLGMQDDLAEAEKEIQELDDE